MASGSLPVLQDGLILRAPNRHKVRRGKWWGDMEGGETREWDGFDQNSSASVKFSIDSIFIFSDHALLSSCLAHLSLLYPSCRVHTVSLHQAPGLRIYLHLLEKSQCLHNILCLGHLPKKATKTLLRSRKTSWGQKSASSKADTGAKVEYGLFPSALLKP